LKAMMTITSTTTIAQKAEAENNLPCAFRSLHRVVAEACTQPKANEHFMALRAELAATEDRTSPASEDQNVSVLHYNTRIESLPDNLVTRLLRFKEHESFRLSSEAERDPARWK